jgi:hypothetical protein
MNLYLHILPLSLHPPTFLKGLITGELRRYYLLNNTDGFINMLTKFISRLLNRGHKFEALAPLLLQTANSLESYANAPAQDNSLSTLYIHIQKTYNATLKDILPYNKMQLALSRPKNLRDVLAKSTVTLLPNLAIDSLIQQCTLEKLNREN